MLICVNSYAQLFNRQSNVVSQLLQITRTSETTWETKNILPVSFASLIMPNGTGPIDLIDLRELL